MNTIINNSRKNFEKLGTIYNSADKVEITKDPLGDTDCYWFNQKKIDQANKVIIYLHGGCFVLGSIKSHKALVSHIAKHLDLPILFIEYSLAPEKPFPQAIQDIEKAYTNFHLQHPEKEILLMGDSAGAGLALSTLSIIDKQQLKNPSKMIMLSPWLDLSCSNESLTTNANLDPILSRESLKSYASLYIQEEKLSEVNPIECSFKNAPPTLILVGSGEVLLDDSKIIHKKISMTHNKVKLSIYENQNHVWMLENIHTKASINALNEIKCFVNS